MIEKQQMFDLGFKDNKYLDKYILLVNQQPDRHSDTVYTERHHIIPRCLNGGDEEENLSVLTFREHFIAHRLLIRCSEGHLRDKMRRAIQMVVVRSWEGTRHITPMMVDIVKREGAIGCKIPDDVKEKIKKSHKSKWDNYTSEERNRILTRVVETTQTDTVKLKRWEGLKAFFESPEGILEAKNRQERRKAYLSNPDNLNKLKEDVSKSWDNPETRKNRIEKIQKAAYGENFKKAQAERWEKYWLERGGKREIIRKSVPDEEKVTCPRCGKRVKFLSHHIKKHEKGLLKKG